jgi:hypothetical protein
MVLKLCPVIPANAGIHNHRYLLNGFDRDRFIASAAFGFLSALPDSGLFKAGKFRSTERLGLFAVLMTGGVCCACLFGFGAYGVGGEI